MTQGELLAELVADAVRETAGAVGVVVRDVPRPDDVALLGHLSQMARDGLAIRVAYLLGLEDPDSARAMFAPGTFATDVESAEQWRNERGLNDLIVVIARGDEPKLTSLEEFRQVTSSDLKPLLVRRALAGQAGGNEVQERWWGLLLKDGAIGLGQLAAYHLALEEGSGPTFLQAAGRQLHLLGLLTDPAFFDRGRRADLVRRMDDHRELLRRLQMLTPQDRRRLSGAVAAETSPDRRRELAAILSKVVDAVVGDGESVSFDEAKALLGLRRSGSRRSDTGTNRREQPPSERAAMLATQALLDQRDTDIAAVREHLDQRFGRGDTAGSNNQAESRRTEIVRVALEDEREAVVTVRQDVLALSRRLLDVGVYGGLMRVPRDEPFDAILRRIDLGTGLVKRWERDELTLLLGKLARVPAGARVLAAFTEYDGAREAILSLQQLLAAEPMAAVASPDLRAQILTTIEAYQRLVGVVIESQAELADASDDAATILSDLLLIETVVFATRERDNLQALMLPTHPLYLWPFATFATLVDQQRERLDESDRRLVVKAGEHLPSHLTSLTVPATVTGQAQQLPYRGRVGHLPLFGQQAAVSDSPDGIEQIGWMVEAYTRAEPHARAGLRLAVVDPPDVGALLTTICDLHDQEILQGAHLIICRKEERAGPSVIDVATEDEERVAQLFGALAPGRRFTLDVEPIDRDGIGPSSPERFHVVALFDRTEAKATPLRITGNQIQPLAVQRRLRFSLVSQSVDLAPVPAGIFGQYDKLAHQVADVPPFNHLSVHQGTELRAKLGTLGATVPCTIVADRHVDRDLQVGALRVASATQGERQVAAFTASTAAYRRPLRDVARAYNTLISDAELDGLLRQLSDLLDQGMLLLQPDESGRVNHNAVKGLLGTLIAARWFKEANPSGRMVVSLDSANAREWMRLRTDASRADLLGLEWTDDHCTVSVIEVKAVEHSGEEYVVANGRVSGPAIGQLLETRRLLAEIFRTDREDELITTPARREILREHFAAELTKASHSPEEREAWTRRLEKLLEGQVHVDFRCQIIDVRLGVDDTSLTDRAVVAEDGGTPVPVQITQLNERRIEALRPAPASASAVLGNAERPGLRGGRGDENQPAPEEPPSQTTLVVRADASQRGVVPADHPEGAELHEVTVPGREGTGRARALIGTAPGAYGVATEIWFDPNQPRNPLPNPHILITGETGSGKTQAIKGLLFDLRRAGVPALILDFKDDYSDPGYCAEEDLAIYDPVIDPLPFNPMALPVDPRNRRASAVHHTHQLSEIVKRIYGLGDQQAYRLREAVKRAYEEQGIPEGSFEPTAGQSYPTFADVGELLKHDRGAEALIGRLSPIFDLGLFDSRASQSVGEILSRGTVVRLAQLPGDETKNSVAEFFLMALYNHLIRQPQSHRLSQLLVLDEAWRLVDSPYLEPIMREGRALGLGVIVASQFPRDLPEVVAGSTATKLYFSQTQPEQIRVIQRTLVGKTSGSEADHVAALQRGLTPLTCLVVSKQAQKFQRVTVRPYFECRLAEE